MSQHTQANNPIALDPFGISLDKVAQLCRSVAGELTLEDASDRPALWRALRRAQESAEHVGAAFASTGHGQEPPPLPPPTAASGP